jgi:hypothetical protein
MTATQYYEYVHGKVAPFLSKEAVVALLESYADHRFEQFKNNKTTFNTEQWVNETEIRKKFPKK